MEQLQFFTQSSPSRSQHDQPVNLTDDEFQRRVERTIDTVLFDYRRGKWTQPNTSALKIGLEVGLPELKSFNRNTLEGIFSELALFYDDLKESDAIGYAVNTLRIIRGGEQLVLEQIYH